MGFVIPRARAPIATVRCSCKGVGKHPGALDPLAHMPGGERKPAFPSAIATQNCLGLPLVDPSPVGRSRRRRRFTAFSVVLTRSQEMRVPVKLRWSDSNRAVVGHQLTRAITAVVISTAICVSAAGARESIKPHKASCINRAFTAFVLKVRPVQCIMAASPQAPFGRAANLAQLRWKTWGGARAVASGYELGFHLPYAHIPAVVTLTQPTFVEELGIYVYKRFRVTSRYGTLSGTIQAG